MLHDDKVWTFDYSVVCSVTVEFAWKFWTDVSNWAMDADVESVEIDGPFAAGARVHLQQKLRPGGMADR